VASRQEPCLAGICHRSHENHQRSHCKCWEIADHVYRACTCVRLHVCACVCVYMCRQTDRYGAATASLLSKVLGLLRRRALFLRALLQKKLFKPGRCEVATASQPATHCNTLQYTATHCNTASQPSKLIHNVPVMDEYVWVNTYRTHTPVNTHIHTHSLIHDSYTRILESTTSCPLSLISIVAKNSPQK